MSSKDKDSDKDGKEAVRKIANTGKTGKVKRAFEKKYGGRKPTEKDPPKKGG